MVKSQKSFLALETGQHAQYAPVPLSRLHFFVNPIISQYLLERVPFVEESFPEPLPLRSQSVREGISMNHESQNNTIQYTLLLLLRLAFKSAETLKNIIFRPVSVIKLTGGMTTKNASLGLSPRAIFVLRFFFLPLQPLYFKRSVLNLWKSVHRLYHALIAYGRDCGSKVVITDLRDGRTEG